MTIKFGKLDRLSTAILKHNLGSEVARQARGFQHPETRAAIQNASITAQTCASAEEVALARQTWQREEHVQIEDRAALRQDASGERFIAAWVRLGDEPPNPDQTRPDQTRGD